MLLKMITASPMENIIRSCTVIRVYIYIFERQESNTVGEIFQNVINVLGGTIKSPTACTMIAASEEFGT
jgi:hypothetical protein